jgi:hypothetical protein
VIKWAIVLVFLPGVWIAYGIFRFLLSFFSPPLTVADEVAMSFLGSFVYLICSFLIAWEHRNDSPKRF